MSNFFRGLDVISLKLYLSPYSRANFQDVSNGPERRLNSVERTHPNPHASHNAKRMQKVWKTVLNIVNKHCCKTKIRASSNVCRLIPVGGKVQSKYIPVFFLKLRILTMLCY